MRFFRRTLLAALLVTAPALSQTPEQEANARFQAGLRYYDAREFEPARLAFTQAYSVLPKPGILINLALSELYAGHELDALSHLEQYLADPSAPAEKRDRAQRALDEAMKKTSHLSIKSSASAEVKVDNKLVSLTTVHVMPGTHALEARAGEKVRSQSVDVKAGEKARRRFELRRADATSGGHAAADRAAAGRGCDAAAEGGKRRGVDIWYSQCCWRRALRGGRRDVGRGARREWHGVGCERQGRFARRGARRECLQHGSGQSEVRGDRLEWIGVHQRERPWEDARSDWHRGPRRRRAPLRELVHLETQILHRPITGSAICSRHRTPGFHHVFLGEHLVIKSFSTLCALGVFVVLVNCSGDVLPCEDTKTCGLATPGDGGGPDSGPGPVCDASKDPSCVTNDSGFFVDAAGSDGAAGTKEAPLKTIGAAVAKAGGAKSNVFICAGTYPEHVKLTSAMNLVGGFTCGSWSYAAGTRPKVAPADAGYALDVGVAGNQISISDLEFEAIAGTAQSVSSIAVFLHDSKVSLSRVTATANAGANGANAVTGSNFNTGLLASDPTIAGKSAMTTTGGARQDCLGLCLNGVHATGGKGGDGPRRRHRG